MNDYVVECGQFIYCSLATKSCVVISSAHNRMGVGEPLGTQHMKGAHKKMD